jgi:hypothetical protein
MLETIRPYTERVHRTLANVACDHVNVCEVVGWRKQELEQSRWRMDTPTGRWVEREREKERGRESVLMIVKR